MRMSVFSVSEVARRLNCRPRDISDAFYLRLLDDAVCPVVSGRRIIPAEYIEIIRQVLAENGKIQSEEPVK